MRRLRFLTPARWQVGSFSSQRSIVKAWHIDIGYWMLPPYHGPYCRITGMIDLAQRDVTRDVQQTSELSILTAWVYLMPWFAGGGGNIRRSPCHSPKAQTPMLLQRYLWFPSQGNTSAIICTVCFHLEVASSRRFAHQNQQQPRHGRQRHVVPSRTL